MSHFVKPLAIGFAMATILMATEAAAQSGAPSTIGLPYGAPISLTDARKVAAAAQAEAAANGWLVVTTIVEPNGQVVLSEKMDGTAYSALDVAGRKAVTSAHFKRPTLAFYDAVKGGTLNAIFAQAVAIEGGEPIVMGGKIVGALGVSGATPAQDGQIARAGVKAVK
ncbi:GlcG/HbpS family heme-binding protein [Caulobacter sp. NIBR2454]|uniref:GlcG/HbpS family heme-binding protein n=1 Tax=Caulobacter sp. NIBR2454 TaxID=3015996 RepID=UPI0022B639CC|nr:heme-binding protein [Caulobacter sp. NIBR2454]